MPQSYCPLVQLSSFRLSLTSVGPRNLPADSAGRGYFTDVRGQPRGATSNIGLVSMWLGRLYPCSAELPSMPILENSTYVYIRYSVCWGPNVNISL